MTKSSRHKKLRKQEKAKTQLTGVKKLNKAQNVVIPTLRVKKILIREQLKSSSVGVDTGLKRPASSSASQASLIEDEEEAFTKRKQSVQELLSSSNHHNVNLRKDAVLGLQEIASSQMNTIIRNLDKIVSKIASLTSDQDGSVRKENLKLAEIIFSKITGNQLKPFWNMLIAHLKCTLTHLMASVRYGALAFIEILVDHHPTLVNDSSTIILPSILSLISTSKNTSTDGKRKSKVTASARLKVDVSGQHCDIQERLKVLNLLSKCLQMTSMDYSGNATGMRSRITTPTMKPIEHLSLSYPFGYSWDQTREAEIKLNNPHVGFSSDFSRGYARITADLFASNFTSESSEISSNFWQDFVHSCVAVLIETWVELMPNTQQEHKNTSKKQGNKRKTSGSDKEATITHRRNACHILNESLVDNLICIVTLFEHILNGNSKYSTSNATRGDDSISNDLGLQMIKDIRKVQGQRIVKYLFDSMPYVALQDSKKKDVMKVNLKLFLVAGKLKMCDSSMRRKLKTFIGNSEKWPTMDKGQCRLILDIIGLLSDAESQQMTTKFILFACKVGHCDVIAEYLRDLIHPSAKGVQAQSILNLEWEEVISTLVESWSMNSNNVEILLDILTFASLRQLTRTHYILTKYITKLKELLTASKNPNIRDIVFRTCSYSEADSLFRTEFSHSLPSTCA